MNSGFVRKTSGGIELDVVVQPRAARNQVAGEHGGRLKIQLTAPPVDDAANQALLVFLSEKLLLPRRNLELLLGRTSRKKRVSVAGIEPLRALELLKA